MCIWLMLKITKLYIGVCYFYIGGVILSIPVFLFVEPCLTTDILVNTGLALLFIYFPVLLTLLVFRNKEGYRDYISIMVGLGIIIAIITSILFIFYTATRFVLDGIITPFYN